MIEKDRVNSVLLWEKANQLSMKNMMIEGRGHLESGMIGRESSGRLEIDDRLTTESVEDPGSMSAITTERVEDPGSMSAITMESVEDPGSMSAIETVTGIAIESDGDEARADLVTEKEREIEVAGTTIVVEKQTAKQDGDAIETVIQTGAEEAETADRLHQAGSLAVVKTSGHGADRTALEVATAHSQTTEEALRLKTLEFTALLVPMFVPPHQEDKGHRQVTTTNSDAVIGIGVRVANVAGTGADWLLLEG
jgi:hypothetical protein